jgi:lipoyl(octanoyl) transferase
MKCNAPPPAPRTSPCPRLRGYLLGTVDFEAVLGLQRMLAFQIAGERDSAALVLCEHPPLITVGRHGSPGHIRCDAEELAARRWRVRWVNRGGGCLLHLPGQLAVYPIVPLDALHLGVAEYLERLHSIVRGLLADFDVRGTVRPGHSGVWVGNRMVAGVGVAVCDWVAYFGVALNVDPDLTPFRLVQTGAPEDGPMTSLARERRGPVRPSLVRERLLEHFHTALGCQRTDLFFSHPLLASAPPVAAIAKNAGA